MNIPDDELRRAWDRREATFPKFTRMKWEQATELARSAFMQGYQIVAKPFDGADRNG